MRRTLLVAAALAGAAAVFTPAAAVAQTPDAERIAALVADQVAFSQQKSADDLTVLPLGTRLHDVQFPVLKDDGTPDHIAIYLDIPDAVVEDPEFTAYSLNLIGGEFVALLGHEDLSGYFLYVRDPATGEYLGADEFFPPEPPKEWEYPTDYATLEQAQKAGLRADLPVKGAATSLGSAQVNGSLTSKTVYINQGHGWVGSTTGSWRVQRGNTCDLVEDFTNAEFNNLYVLPMLRNAGAKVQTVREADFQTNMVVVDNADTVANSRGRYYETGTWADSSVDGYVHQTRWDGKTINPFDQGAGENRLAPNLTTGAPTATANWVANIPEDGYYNVYASWAAFSGRASDAQYLVHHSGGVSEVRMNQQIDGYTWNLLGNFYFEAGAPESERMVTLTNNSTSGAINVSADAVRWGGGMGDVARQSSTLSGRPRWEEDAVNYLQYTGFGYSGDLYTGTNDESGGWSDRPQYARWEHTGKDGGVEDAVYYAWHTNAFNSSTPPSCDGTARGVVTYRHSNASTASANFQALMHDKTYNAVNQLWYTGSTWTVRPKLEGNFGENNQLSLGSTLPGFLYEGLFHDNNVDGIDYNEPELRYIMARSVQQGLIDWFNQQDGTSRPYPPEMPRDFAVETLPNGTVELSWVAGPTGGFNGATATGYRIYRSPNGFGFDDGTDVTGTTTTLTLPADGSVQYFRVAGVNAGGVSFPTETLAAARGAGSSVLIVNGFDRNQRSLVPVETIANAGTVLRHDPRDFQSFNYVVEHAEALEGRGLRISSTSNDRVANSTINLAGYASVFWICGEESTADDTFSAAEQTQVTNYLNGGGKFFVSGAEIGWDLGRSGSSSVDDLSFYNNVLRTSYVSDDANTYTVVPVGGGVFDGVGTLSFNPAAGARYDAEWPDRIGTSGGSVAVLTYSGGAGGTAGVHYQSGATEVISLGFPFEMIASDAARTAMMTSVFNEFGLTGTAPSEVGDWLIIH